MENKFEQPFAQEFERALLIQKIKDFFGTRKTKGDAMKIAISAMFYKGTPQKPLKFICATKGHIVNAGNIHFCNILSFTPASTRTSTYGSLAVGGSGIPAVPSIRLGVGVGTTTASMTGLVTICNTAPSSIIGLNSIPVATKYRTAITATWNAGVLTAITVTEAALYGYVMGIAQAAFAAAGVVETIQMLDRINTTDGDFGVFTVDIAKPLSLQYNIDFMF